MRTFGAFRTAFLLALVALPACSGAGDAEEAGGSDSSAEADGKPPAPRFSEEDIEVISRRIELTPESEESFRELLDTYESGRATIAKIEDPAEREQASADWDTELVRSSTVIGGEALAIEVEAVLQRD